VISGGSSGGTTTPDRVPEVTITAVATAANGSLGLSLTQTGTNTICYDGSSSGERVRTATTEIPDGQVVVGGHTLTWSVESLTVTLDGDTYSGAPAGYTLETGVTLGGDWDYLGTSYGPWFYALSSGTGTAPATPDCRTTERVMTLTLSLVLVDDRLPGIPLGGVDLCYAMRCLDASAVISTHRADRTVWYRPASVEMRWDTTGEAAAEAYQLERSAAVVVPDVLGEIPDGAGYVEAAETSATIDFPDEGTFVPRVRAGLKAERFPPGAPLETAGTRAALDALRAAYPPIRAFTPWVTGPTLTVADVPVIDSFSSDVTSGESVLMTVLRWTISSDAGVVEFQLDPDSAQTAGRWHGTVLLVDAEGTVLETPPRQFVWTDSVTFSFAFAADVPSVSLVWDPSRSLFRYGFDAEPGETEFVSTSQPDISCTVGTTIYRYRLSFATAGAGAAIVTVPCVSGQTAYEAAAAWAVGPARQGNRAYRNGSPGGYEIRPKVRLRLAVEGWTGWVDLDDGPLLLRPKRPEIVRTDFGIRAYEARSGGSPTYQPDGFDWYDESVHADYPPLGITGAKAWLGIDPSRRYPFSFVLEDPDHELSELVVDWDGSGDASTYDALEGYALGDDGAETCGDVLDGTQWGLTGLLDDDDAEAGRVVLARLRRYSPGLHRIPYHVVPRVLSDEGWAEAQVTTPGFGCDSISVDYPSRPDYTDHAVRGSSTRAVRTNYVSLKLTLQGFRAPTPLLRFAVLTPLGRLTSWAAGMAAYPRPYGVLGGTVTGPVWYQWALFDDRFGDQKAAGHVATATEQIGYLMHLASAERGFSFGAYPLWVKADAIEVRDLDTWRAATSATVATRDAAVGARANALRHLFHPTSAIPAPYTGPVKVVVWCCPAREAMWGEGASDFACPWSPDGEGVYPWDEPDDIPLDWGLTGEEIRAKLADGSAAVWSTTVDLPGRELAEVSLPALRSADVGTSWSWRNSAGTLIPCGGEHIFYPAGGGGDGFARSLVGQPYAVTLSAVRQWATASRVPEAPDGTEEILVSLEGACPASGEASRGAALAAFLSGDYSGMLAKLTGIPNLLVKFAPGDGGKILFFVRLPWFRGYEGAFHDAGGAWFAAPCDFSPGHDHTVAWEYTPYPAPTHTFRLDGTVVKAFALRNGYTGRLVLDQWEPRVQRVRVWDTLLSGVPFSGALHMPSVRCFGDGCYWSPSGKWYWAPTGDASGLATSADAASEAWSRAEEAEAERHVTRSWATGSAPDPVTGADWENLWG